MARRKPRKQTSALSRRQRRRSWALGLLVVLLLALVVVYGWQLFERRVHPVATPAPHATTHHAPKLTAGTLTSVVSITPYSADQVVALARENYGSDIATPTTAVTKILFTYTSTDASGKLITVYARAYLPATTHAPILAMAPGTTGVGPQCAPSLEQPAVHNWANYDSHMMAYAHAGYTGVITDYDEMRQPGGVQPYMVGRAEGQAVLDSVRALEELPAAQKVIDPSHVFAAGYSQGGHAALWTDQLNAAYAPSVKLSGVIGWGPVTDVTESLADITKGSTLDWFGPNVLVSYENYYKTTYPLANIVLPERQANLTADVLSHCIDSDIAFWGTAPAKLYTPQFIAALQTRNLPADQFGALGAQMAANQAGNEATSTPKLINQGQLDNVILPAQSQAAMTRMCGVSTGPVQLKLYPKSTHYTIMRDSYTDTLTWMSGIIHGGTAPTSCG